MEIRWSRETGRAGWILIAVLSVCSSYALGQSPGAGGQSAPLRRFNAKFFQPGVASAPGRALARLDSMPPECEEFHRRVANALAEAAEILTAADLPGDVKCPVRLELEPGGSCVQIWVRKRAPDETAEEFEARQRSSRIGNRYDYDQIQEAGRGVQVKVVDELDFCLNANGEVIGRMETVPLYGCALPDRTFAVKRTLLADAEKRAVVFAHEYGHNAGNYDQLGDPVRVMGGEARQGPGITFQRVVTQEECRRYQEFTAEYQKERAKPPARDAGKKSGGKREPNRTGGQRKKG